jgi:hypothetical protein
MIVIHAQQIIDQCLFDSEFSIAGYAALSFQQHNLSCAEGDNVQLIIEKMECVPGCRWGVLRFIFRTVDYYAV